MAPLKAMSLVGALVLGAGAVSDAFAHGGFHHHHRARVGVFIGAPVVFAPWYYYPPFHYYPSVHYYHYPPAVVVPSSPPVYIERGDTQPAPAPQAYWYYCPESRAYYPYVDRCPGGWQRVVPQPPPS